jgi:hypothetical protein
MIFKLERTLEKESLEMLKLQDIKKQECFFQ